MVNLLETWLGATLSAMAAAAPSGAPGTEGSSEPSLGGMLPIFALMAVFFYLMVMRPQKKEQQKKKSMLNDLQKGDRVVTIGGFHGKVHSLDENRNVVSLEVAPKVVMKINRDAVGSVEKKSNAPDKADQGQKK